MKNLITTTALCLTLGLHTPLQASETPELLFQHDAEDSLSLALTLKHASIRFHDTPCTCQKSSGSGIVRLSFSNADETIDVFVTKTVGPRAPAASAGNPNLKVYMPDKSVWVASRMGHMEVIKAAGTLDIAFKNYECSGADAKANIAITGEVVHTPSTLAAMLGPYESDKRATVSFPATELTLKRSLLTSEQCPE